MVKLTSRNYFNFSRKVSEYFMIRDSTRIPSILWFEYTRAREEVRYVFNTEMCIMCVLQNAFLLANFDVEFS